MNINEFGFLRVASASPKLRVADCDYNTGEIKLMIGQALQEGVQIVCFPELCITSYSCGDLFFQEALQQKALSSLIELSRFVREKESIIAIVGLPLRVKNSLYNMAAVLTSDGIAGFTPKKFIPNHAEFQEKRWFAPGDSLSMFSIDVDGESLPASAEGMIFYTPFGNFGIEICEDLWMRTPPSSDPQMLDADIIFNLSASNELVGKNNYRRSLVLQQSARCNSAYVYTSAGVGESTTDMVFSGACFIAENGKMLAESKRFSLENELIIADVDIDALRHDKLINTNHNSPACARNFPAGGSHLPTREDQPPTGERPIKGGFQSTARWGQSEIAVPLTPAATDSMYRTFKPHPFIPSDAEKDNSLEEIITIQAHGLAKRMLHTGIGKAVIGISGGLDSTLALLVTIKAFDLQGLPHDHIHGITMPGLGTTKRTYANATTLMQLLGITCKEISIVDAVTQHFKDIGHDINSLDITFENSQARERTQVLMDYANKVDGLVIGTGNMSELALGWTTYNGDHMSMYAINSGVPKTLVETLVSWIADNNLDEASRKVVHDILDTPFSPELLPAGHDGKIAQKTEHLIGPYELHDFFLYRMLRFGDNPGRILFIASRAFAGKYTRDEILPWLKVFYKRFFTQQFKRSCMPDSPKVGSANLSPRGSWRMPSDAVANAWLKELE